MSAFQISERTRENIAACIGIPFENIVNLSLDEEIAVAEKKHGGKIVFSKSRNAKRIGRGNPLLSRKKIRTLQDIEKKIMRVK